MKPRVLSSSVMLQWFSGFWRRFLASAIMSQAVKKPIALLLVDLFRCICMPSMLVTEKAFFQVSVK